MVYVTPRIRILIVPVGVLGKIMILPVIGSTDRIGINVDNDPPASSVALYVNDPAAVVVVE